jgi:hypothetical protein
VVQQPRISSITSRTEPITARKFSGRLNNAGIEIVVQEVFAPPPVDDSEIELLWNPLQEGYFLCVDAQLVLPDQQQYHLYYDQRAADVIAEITVQYLQKMPQVAMSTGLIVDFRLFPNRQALLELVHNLFDSISQFLRSIPSLRLHRLMREISEPAMDETPTEPKAFPIPNAIDEIEELRTSRLSTSNLNYFAILQVSLSTVFSNER